MHMLIKKKNDVETVGGAVLVFWKRIWMHKSHKSDSDSHKSEALWEAEHKGDECDLSSGGNFKTMNIHVVS
jgi:hypothetical protein